MNAQTRPTTVCLTCSKVVFLDLIYENLNLAVKYRDGISFKCSNCGRVIAQAFLCSKCGQATLKDLTVEWVRPDVCMNYTENGFCPQTFHPEHFVELPIS
jgi:hypothetical protein